MPRATTHANGVKGIQLVTVAVSDVAAVRGWYERVPGAKVMAVDRPDLKAAGVRAKIGPHALDFVAPRGPESALSGWLAARGPSPYSASLAASSPKGLLPVERTLGARLSLG